MGFLMGERRKYLLKVLLDKIKKDHENIYPPLAVFNYDVIGRHIIYGGFFELPYLIALRDQVFPKLKSKFVCIDVGANIGNHTVYFADHFVSVQSFEPNKRVFKLLEANSMLRSNIKVFNLGASNKSQAISIKYNNNNVGMASVEKVTGDIEAIFQLEPLDEIVTKENIGEISFIKIDVEGHELQALQGAVKTIKKYQPVVALELLGRNLNGPTSELELLRSLGYAYFYEFKDKLKSDWISPKLYRILNGLSVLVFNKKITKNLILCRITEQLDSRKDYVMIIASTYTLLSGD